MTLLECRGLRHGFGGRDVLRGVDLRVAEGERVALVGRSGQGKSTLVRALLALETVRDGVIECAGRPVTPGRVRSLRWFRRLVQYVPQDPASTLDPRARVRDVVDEPRLRLGQGDGAAALDLVALPGHLADARVGELSGGQAQRVAIARALAVGPRLLLADEPVSGLDPPLREHVLDALRRAPCGLLMVTHDLSAAAALCDRILLLHDGRIVDDPSHSEFRALLDAVPTVGPSR
ncbi:MAG TPA: dipeptide/oligopeptide/nickel ABC transporter ATP-binding protein [Actinoplanes sp.]|nr:dipeptide/oligopeptide/nickel ABC transporter ATP-binding protein [Actinoplanes sp.]